MPAKNDREVVFVGGVWLKFYYDFSIKQNIDIQKRTKKSLSRNKNITFLIKTTTTISILKTEIDNL